MKQANGPRIAGRVVLCALLSGPAGFAGASPPSGVAKNSPAAGVHQHVTIHRLDSTVGQALDWIGRSAGTEVRVLARDDAHPSGIDPTRPVTIDGFEGSLLDLLALVLEAAHESDAPAERPEWQFAREGAILVGTVERLNAVRTTVIYDIRDLLRVSPNWIYAPELDLEQALQGSGSILRGGEQSPLPPALDDSAPPRWIELADIITTTIEPDVWFDHGGDSLLRHRDGQFIISAPGYVHRQILRDPHAPPRPDHAQRLP
jgi:hypothetical protein